MKFIIDQQLPPVLIDWLRQRGHEAEHVRNIGLRDAPDRDIWQHAVSDGAIIVTKDEDFASRRKSVTAGPPVVWLRCGNATTKRLTEFLHRNWSGIEAELRRDASVIEVR